MNPPAPASPIPSTEVMMMPQPRIAYQLYSARQEAARDLPAVLRALKEQDYDGVEFAGFHGHSAENIAGLLAESGLAVASSHVSLAELRQDAHAVIAFHQRIGCPYIAIPYLADEDRPGQPGFARLIARIYWLGQLCREAGIQLLYHNHDFEFAPVSGMHGLDFLYDAIPADLLQTEIDTCWVRYAGVDPVEYLRKYAGRAPVVHMKDYVGRKGGTDSPYQLIGQESKAKAEQSAFAFRPLGRGIQELPALVRAAVAAGSKWLVVEQDDSPDMPPLEASAISIAELRKHL